MQKGKSNVTIITNYIQTSNFNAIFAIKILTNVAKKIVTKILQTLPPYYDVTILAVPKSVIPS